MNWDTILQNKKQCVTWKDEIIDKSVIESIMLEVHEHCNSKQNRVPIRLDMLDWSNVARRNYLFEYATDLDNGHKNTQVLAPWVVCLSIRDVPSLRWKDLVRIGGIEMGLTAQFIVLAATARGYDVGFCACKQGENSKKFSKKMRIPAPDLMLGIGHYEKKAQQRNPGNGKDYWATVSSAEAHTTHVKPPMEEYVKFHV